jgi:ADP-heptose:LPS heptosyltransferase
MRPRLKTDSAAPLAGASRILIVRLRSLGDCVLSTPAIHLLKRHRPAVRIAVVVEPQWRAVYEGNPDIAAIIPPTHKAVWDFDPDVVIDFHGGNTAARLTFFSRAKYRCGYEHYKRRAAYNIRIPRVQDITGYSRTVHTAEHMATSTFYLGAKPHEIPRACLFADPPTGARAPYAVIHPVAATPEKTWGRDGFLQVAEHLRSQHGLEPVFIAAAGQDLAPFAQWETVIGASLPAIKTLISGATLFVGNDSGPAHIAAAFGVPPVVVFGPSDPVIWGPWRTPGEVIKACGCIDSVSASQVMSAVDKMRVPA